MGKGRKRSTRKMIQRKRQAALKNRKKKKREAVKSSRNK